ncbi:MAG: transcriptional regulator [Deltaproteobacteria bacterium HGW-Deltaproteobacteria-14]|jgi:heme exporter protein B|nr:MAG: transcriptional regulator [Deltaproteobacteria bacterium HGW-Deltaproteobacteria-14]
MTLGVQTRAILGKDLRVTWRGRARSAAVFAFAGTVLLLFSFAVGPDSKTLAQHAPGYFWIALLLGSVLTLSDAFRVETEDDALDAMRVLPVDPRALFLGKAAASAITLAALAAALTPVAGLLYGVGVQGSWLQLLVFIVLGAAGLAAPGTLYAAMTAKARGREVMLPLLLFPLVIPVLLAAVKGTALALAGDPMGQVPSWLGVLVAFDLVYWAVCPLLLGAVIES